LSFITCRSDFNPFNKSFLTINGSHTRGAHLGSLAQLSVDLTEDGFTKFLPIKNLKIIALTQFTSDLPENTNLNYKTRLYRWKKWIAFVAQL